MRAMRYVKVKCVANQLVNPHRDALPANVGALNAPEDAPLQDQGRYLWYVIQENIISGGLAAAAWLPSIQIVAVRQKTVFNFVPHFPKHKDGGDPKSPLLVGVERFIERLPCVGESFDLRRSLTEGIGASTQEVDWIAVLQDFDGIAVAQLTNPCFPFGQARLPPRRPGAYRLFYWRPKFLLVRCHLQGEFHD